jgi:hypothetical protein
MSITLEDLNDAATVLMEFHITHTNLTLEEVQTVVLLASMQAVCRACGPEEPTP